MRPKCPYCNGCIRKLKPEELGCHYLGSYENGLPNSTNIEIRTMDCWGYCKKCGYVDP